jgi:signal transduction histidine kinase
MTSQWAAVGAETDPLRRARQLQRSWERLLADGALGPELPPGATVGLRPTIVESWQRSLATGLDPTDLLAPIEADASEVVGRWFEHPLGSLTHVLTEQLRNLAEESRGIVVVTDASGLVLHRVGDERLKERAAEMNLIEGARYNEAADGTNGIGTALAADHAFQVFAYEHFNERHHQWVCSGAPVHDPVSGQTVGLIDLSSLWKIAHPRSLQLVTTAARAIEQSLVDARRDRDARLRRRYGDFMTRSTDLLVDRDGYALDGAKLGHPSPVDNIPEDGGEVVLSDGSVAVAAPLGRGEAYLLRQSTTRHPRSAPAIKGLERAEEHARELATEQAGLRQIATLVAGESSPDQLFTVVAEQVARIFDVPHVRLVRYEPDGSVVVGGFSEGGHEPFPIGSRWPLDSPGVTATVRQTGRPARVEDYAQLAGEVAEVVRGAGMRSSVATPIVVERRLWGAMVVLSPRDEPLPADTEARLTDFTELVATAIANAESRAALAQLAQEQTALRRVATLVAGGTGPEQLFAAVADEVQELVGAEISAIVRFEDDDTALTVGARGGPNAAGTRAELDLDFVVASVRETRRAARFDTDDPAAADMPSIVRAMGARSAVAGPIVVEGKLWGAIVVGSLSRSLPPETERRLADFTELIATAVANTQARQEVTALADEQAALRRVAVLVAHGVRPARIFSAVSDEVGRLFGCDQASVTRFESEGPAIVVVGVAQNIEEVVTVGTRWELHDSIASAHVFRTGRSARIDRSAGSSAGGPAAETIDHLDLQSTVASPIVVEGRLWGTITISSSGERLPADTEQRVEKFTELVATAIANAESRVARAVLTDEQAALRHVATLVAQGTSPQDLFEAVAEEVGRLLPVGSATMGRYEPDDSVTTVASWSSTEVAFPTGGRWPTEGTNVAWTVLQTGHAARIDDFSAATDPIGVAARESGIKSAVGSPIVVEGHLWGVVTATSSEGPLPAGTEARLASFTELVATAIANAESSAELAASRRRIVAASDDARRRIERNLHDGTQQRLVSLGLAVRAAEANLAPERQDVQDQLSRVAIGLADAVEDLQEISRGIHPAILSKGGLGPALQTLAHRSPIPVDLDLTTDVRLPEPIEVAAYFVASEALANAAKHSDASRIDVSLERRDGNLLLSVRDDGVGGADAARGSGIVGLNDRVEALGGSLRVDSLPGEGTQILARLPLDLELNRHV